MRSIVWTLVATSVVLVLTAAMGFRADVRFNLTCASSNTFSQVMTRSRIGASGRRLCWERPLGGRRATRITRFVRAARPCAGKKDVVPAITLTNTMLGLVLATVGTGLLLPVAAAAETVSVTLPGGPDNMIYFGLDHDDSEFPGRLVRGATISVFAPGGVDFRAASVEAYEGLNPEPVSSPSATVPTTVSADGRRIDWTVPSDTPVDSYITFDLVGTQTPGYSAWNFDSRFSSTHRIEGGGAGEKSFYPKLVAAFYESAPVTFPAGEPITWSLPTSSLALSQLEAGTGVPAQFLFQTHASINRGETGVATTVSEDRRSLTGTLPDRPGPFQFSIYSADEVSGSSLIGLNFLYGDVSVTTTSPPTCEPADQVQGAIRERYISLNGPCGFLGNALTSELSTPVKLGRYNHFEGGSIYWSSMTGAWEVHGAIRDTWSRLGWENSAVGFPVTNETPTPNKVGAFNHFQAGSVYWSPATGAHEVRGAIRDTWSRLGWENSSLGFPTTDEYTIPGGRRSDFQHGSITWNASTGAVAHFSY